MSELLQLTINGSMVENVTIYIVESTTVINVNDFDLCQFKDFVIRLNFEQEEDREECIWAATTEQIVLGTPYLFLKL